MDRSRNRVGVSGDIGVIGDVDTNGDLGLGDSNTCFSHGRLGKYFRSDRVGDVCCRSETVFEIVFGVDFGESRGVDVNAADTRGGVECIDCVRVSEFFSHGNAGRGRICNVFDLSALVLATDAVDAEGMVLVEVV